MKLQQNRYLWVYVAGLAAIPLLLDFCLAGLASAGPALPFGGQFWAIALLCIPPSLAMQWLKPFYIFSLPPLVVRPTELKEEQRRCLRLFQSWQIKALASVVGLFLFWLLQQLYLRAASISPIFTPTGGWLIALVTFFFACALLQVSVSALRALLVGPEALKRVAAYDVDAIAQDFLLVGFQVNRILPEETAPAAVATHNDSERSNDKDAPD